MIARRRRRRRRMERGREGRERRAWTKTQSLKWTPVMFPVEIRNKDEVLFRPQGCLPLKPWYIFFCPRDPLMHKKLLQYQRKTNAVFFPLSLASFTGMKGKRVSPGNGASPYWCYCSEVEKRLAICCWCCDPCFTWLAFKSPLPSDDGWLCWHQVAPIGGKTDSYHDNLWMETTWLAEQSSFCQAGGWFFFFFFFSPALKHL